MTLIHFATNREEVFQGDRVVGFTERLNPKSPIYVRYGEAEITPPSTIADMRVAREQIPSYTAAADAPKILGSDSVFEALRLRLKENNADLLMYLHGYAATLQDAFANAALLKIQYAPSDMMLESAVFSWPANGEMKPILDYASDRDDARQSAKAVARTLRRLMEYMRGVDKDDWCNADFHLVAHSMGNYMLRNTLQALLSDLGEKTLPRLFKNIFLMAADEDADAFEDPAKLARLPELAEAVHVYFARNDLALTISDKTKARPDRLGSAGPRTLTSLPHKVVLVDCTDVSETASIKDARHQYYRRRDEVIDDVRQVIAGKTPESIDGRRWVPERRCFMIKKYD